MKLSGKPKGREQWRVILELLRMMRTFTPAQRKMFMIHGLLIEKEQAWKRRAVAVTDDPEYLQCCSLREMYKQQLAASQARCRDMEREIETLTTCGCEGCDDNLEESAFCFPCMNKVQKQVTQLQATLAVREAELEQTITRLEGVNAQYYDDRKRLGEQLAALRLTWTTAQPTVAGGYWVKRMFDGYPTYNVMDVTEHGAIGPYHKPLDECIGWEFAGPIPLPTEAQQASGRSGGAANQGAGA